MSGTERHFAVLIINETLARKFIPGQDPIRQQQSLSWGAQVADEIHRRRRRHQEDGAGTGTELTIVNISAVLPMPGREPWANG